MISGTRIGAGPGDIGSGRPPLVYGPPLSGGTDEEVQRFYTPARRLGVRHVLIRGGDQPVNVSLAGSARKSLLVRNLGPNVVWVGDSEDVRAAPAAGDELGGFPIDVGGQIGYAVSEYDGDLYFVCAGGQSADLAVMEPS